MTDAAKRFREEGNRRFQKGDYNMAESLYSQAIIADPKNHVLYTNRAMARLKTNQWENVVADCRTCLGLDPDNMKARYYLSQAQYALQDYDDALKHALEGHALCVKNGDKSMQNLTDQVLKCKKARWDQREKKRKREASDLEREVIRLLEQERDTELAEYTDEGTRKEISDEWEQKIGSMRAVFDKANPQKEPPRPDPPAWAIDDISFNFMVDPVITKTGKSYERSSIESYLRRVPLDPLTREPLFITDLRPNIDLKKACEDYLEENGWAVDY
ncbi:STIP1 homology and U box-containing protein 1 [Podospora australis]|uniref:STIP1 homology and U box-containing protein 1 n=1 Tax=Podospora australis TaxID=1536484 RepID=A0AAN6WY78_9PEZI|nr:STIP1 homology and U box-containing protein 1 [Podospora australis]